MRDREVDKTSESSIFNDKDWHLDKSISITHLFTTIAAVSCLVVVGSKFDTRLTVLESSLEHQKITNLQQEAVTASIRKDVREDLRDINSKLDRLIEKESRLEYNKR